ncbi:hypothetical protein DM01DRAFT_1334381 [Hesseltinella vesiculosa]|uniref:Uncharacterized protein n=1 Tax=Hesseltinella vesiculosa TaxID=101127 RepID=A0A1X2GLS5_9FUNG|nr:hypothetical protein DM01DRAFT_1334381 [Hesseltinella vesiculosa]
MANREEIIKEKLINYKLNDEERLVIRSALFNLVTFASVGAAALGVSGRMWGKSRASVSGKPRTAIPTILGTFTGLALGGLMGMSQGMKKVRHNLPADSPLLSIIKENEQLKSQEETGMLLNTETDPRQE